MADNTVKQTENTLNIKYNGKIYYGEAPEISNCS